MRQIPKVRCIYYYSTLNAPKIYLLDKRRLILALLSHSKYSWTSLANLRYSGRIQLGSTPNSFQSTERRATPVSYCYHHFHGHSGMYT